MRQKNLSLSVLVPVYNEQYLVAHSLRRLKILADCEFISHVQVIVIDNGSTDDTPKALAEFEAQHLALRTQNGDWDRIGWVSHRHPRNLGKGAAIRTALSLPPAT